MFDFDVRGDSWRSEAEMLEELADLPPFDDELRTPIQAIPRLLAPERAADLLLGVYATARHDLGIVATRQQLAARAQRMPRYDDEFHASSVEQARGLAIFPPPAG